MNVQVGINAALLVCIALLAVDNLATRKALRTMSIALDALTVKVASLETQAAATVTALGALQASGENAPALDALGARVQAVTDSLAAAVAPKPAP